MTTREMAEESGPWQISGNRFERVGMREPLTLKHLNALEAKALELEQVKDQYRLTFIDAANLEAELADYKTRLETSAKAAELERVKAELGTTQEHLDAWTEEAQKMVADLRARLEVSQQQTREVEEIAQQRALTMLQLGARLEAAEAERDEYRNLLRLANGRR